MSNELNDVEPTMVQQQELLKEIAMVLVQGSDPGWARLDYRISALGGYREEAAFAVASDGTSERVQISMAARLAVTKLRKVMATPNAGTWYTAVIHVDDTLRFWGDFDYDVQPSWEGKPGQSEYAREQRAYPRSPANQPEWFKAELGR